MEISKVQYISQGNTAQEQIKNIQKVLDNGIDWVQLRWKNADEKAFIALAYQIKKMCENYHSQLIINDLVLVAKEVDAEGVHLGLNDESILNARKILGNDKIIGGTANTLEDVVQRINEKCDYIGLGPFQFTHTKEKLSPVLGLRGYEEIIQSIREKFSIQPKIIAIGGIQMNDVESLIQTGVYGIAVSELFTKYPEMIENVSRKL